MSEGRVRAVAGIGGVVLLGAMFLPWFALDVTRGSSVIASDQGRNAWQAFEWIDYVMVLTAVAALTRAVFGRQVPVLTSPVFLAAAGAATVILIGYRIANRPYEISTPFADVSTSLQVGVFAGLVGALTVSSLGMILLRRG